MVEERGGGGAAPLRVGRREMLADVAGADRAEHRVGDRVEHDVGVAVARRGRGRAGCAMPPSHRSVAGRRRGRRSRGRCAAPAARRAAPRRARNRRRRSACRAAGRPRPSRRRSPAARATWASSVALAARPGRDARARIASKRNACGVWTRTRPSRGTGIAERRRRRAPACRRPAAPGPRRRCVVERGEQPVDHRGGQKGRAASWIRTSRAAVGRQRFEPVADRLLPRRAADDRARGAGRSPTASAIGCLLARADHDPHRVDPRMAASASTAWREHRLAAERGDIAWARRRRRGCRCRRRRSGRRS